MNKRKEFLLGMFIFGALVLLTLSFVFIKDFDFINHPYIVKVSFDFGDGIKAASPVRMAGVDVGEVKKVELQRFAGKTKVVVFAAIKSDIKIPYGSEVFINNLGVLGEKYLEIIPPQQFSRYVKENELIKGENSIPLYKMSRLAKNIMDDFLETLSQIKIFISDDNFRQSLYRMVYNLDKASLKIDEILEDVHSAKGTLGKFLYDDSLYQEAKGFVEDVKKHPWKLLYIPRKDRIELKKKSR